MTAVGERSNLLSAGEKGALPLESILMTSRKACLVTLSATATAGEAIAVLEVDGAVIILDFLDAAAVDRLNADFDPYVKAKPDGSVDHPFDGPEYGAFVGERTKRIGGLAGKSLTFAELIAHPLLLTYADHYLKPNCARYQMNGTTMIAIGPGETAQRLHLDEADWPHFPKPRPHLVVNCIIALSDFTEANGATRVVPGSHRWDDETRAVRDHDIAQAVMPRGSILLYTGKVLHGGGANTTTSECRRGLYFAYCLGWLRQHENQYLVTPPDVARRLPKPAQALLGYTLHDPTPLPGGFLGVVKDDHSGRYDPERLLE